MERTAAMAITLDTTGTHGALKITSPNLSKVLGNSWVREANKLTLSLAISGLAGWLCAWLVTWSMDDAYPLLARALGQAGTHDGVALAMGLWFVLVPLAFSLVFGLCKKRLSGRAFWYAAPVLMVLVLGCGDFILDRSWQDVLEVSPWLAVALASAYAGLFAGMRLKLPR